MATLQKRNPTITVVILNYQTNELVLNLLKLIVTHGDSSRLGDLEIIIVDNSQENSLVKKLPHSENIRYFFQNKNLGFSGGNNVGIKKAKGEWILLLNSDTVIDGKEIRKLVEICRDSNCEVAAPQLTDKEGTIQNTVGYFDGPFKNILNWIFLRPRLINCKRINQHIRVDLAIGAALLVKKTIFEKVGLLDQKNFFMYFEDMDFSYRLFKHKIPILYVPEVTITHFGGTSADKNRSQKNFNYQSGLQNYIKKHRGKFVVLLNRIFKLFR